MNYKKYSPTEMNGYLIDNIHTKPLLLLFPQLKELENNTLFKKKPNENFIFEYTGKIRYKFQKLKQQHPILEKLEELKLCGVFHLTTYGGFWLTNQFQGKIFTNSDNFHSYFKLLGFDNDLLVLANFVYSTFTDTSYITVPFLEFEKLENGDFNLTGYSIPEFTLKHFEKIITAFSELEKCNNAINDLIAKLQPKPIIINGLFPCLKDKIVLPSL